ncbi:hypothetical protein ACFOWA_20430 [Pedobacter lithocola]|uniref:Uncharacterized protein n=1 Tax=Pedobacter lithocola TaxID=1908239 RepID=A0ABV8PH36_9SPHI
MTKKPLLFAILLLTMVYSCKKGTKTAIVVTPPIVTQPPAVSKAEEFIFQSGFEPGSTANTNYPQIVANPTAQGEDIKGNTTGLMNSDWIYDLETKTPVKYKLFRMNYEMGTYTDRRAEIIPNSVKDVGSNNSDNILSFRLTNAVIPAGYTNKGRVAAELFSQSLAPGATTADLAVSSNIREYYQKVKFYLPNDFNLLQASTFPVPNAGDWLLLWEFRDHVPTTTGKDSRITIDITRPNNLSTTKFNFVVSCDEMGVNGAQPLNIWSVQNTNYKIPTGKWLEAEIYIKEGDAGTGRTYFAVREVNATNTGVWNKLCDKYATNIHRNNTSPTGYNGFNPMKLYCSEAVVKPFQVAGKSLQVYWDDLEMYENKLPSVGAITP